MYITFKRKINKYIFKYLCTMYTFIVLLTRLKLHFYFIIIFTIHNNFLKTFIVLTLVLEMFLTILLISYDGL